MTLGKPRDKVAASFTSDDLQPDVLLMELANPMSPDLSLICDGKKFMWDGNPYATREEASALESAYQKDNFEVREIEEEGTFLIYTRRLPKEAVVAAQ